MIRKTVWIAGLFATVMVATLLLSAGSPRSCSEDSSNRDRGSESG